MTSIILPLATGIDLTAPPTNIGTTTPVAVNSTIFTALPANNTSAFVAGGSSLTGANAQSLVNLSQIWNTTGTPTAIFANITDTASNAASRLMDLQVGGVSRFGIRKDGVIIGAAGGNGFAYTGSIANGWGFGTSLSIRGFIGGDNLLHGILTPSSGYIGFSSTNSSLTTNNPDTILRRDAANTLAQRNGVNTQTSRLYKSYTDASNYTRAAWQFDANGVVIAGESAGTGDANIGFSFGIKGTGAFQLQPTDNTATGGNARGANAIDLQTLRSAATQVASGLASFVAGRDNTASAGRAIALGQANVSLGSWSFSAGNTNTASGDYAFALGNGNSAGGANSFALGSSATTRSVTGLISLNVVAYSGTLGSTQTSIATIGAATTDATPTVLKSNSNTASGTNQLTLSNNSSIAFTAIVTASTTAAGDCSSWKFEGQIQRGANAASTALVAAITPALITQKAGASTWAVAVTANTTNGCLAVTVTGQAATTIRWTCTIFASEVAF